MSRVLLIGPSTKALADAIEAGGHQVAYVCLDDERTHAIDAIRGGFDGRSADALMADLRSAADFLPVRHVRWLIRETWGPELHVPCLAVLTAHHLQLPELEVHIDDFLLDPCLPLESEPAIAGCASDDVRGRRAGPSDGDRT